MSPSDRERAEGFRGTAVHVVATLTHGIDSVCTEEQNITRESALDCSEFWHHTIHDEEQLGLLLYRPHPSVENPLLIAWDVTDGVNLYFVGNPFFVLIEGDLYLIFEVSDDSGLNIGNATSQNGFDWGYEASVWCDGLQ